LIKQITGGDPITARFMRQDFFTYQPQFKMKIASNNKPRLKSVDEAMTARMNLMPFVVTIPAGERDPELAEKLKAEWPGILAWMVEGCLAWQRDGLAPPPAVIAATRDYLASENNLQTFIDECCVQAEWTSIKALFFRWMEWVERSNEIGGTRNDFIAALETAGYQKRRRESGVGFLGLGLNPNWHRSDPM
jgi:putative DNA primase/helicase